MQLRLYSKKKKIIKNPNFNLVFKSVGGFQDILYVKINVFELNYQMFNPKHYLYSEDVFINI